MSGEQGRRRGVGRAGGRGRGLAWTLALAAAAGAGWYGWTRTHPREPEAQHRAAPPAVPVSLASASLTDFPVTVDGLGTVQAYNTVLVRTRVDGQIDTVAFREGQAVKQGDLLVQIDARPLRAALEGAQAKKTQDEATLANAKADLGRYQKLGDYATRQQLDTQATTVNQLTAQIAADQAAVDNAQTQLGYTTVRAPITGVAGLRQVDVGNIVNAATQTGIVTLTQVEPIAVIYTANEDQLPAITKAMREGDVPVTALSTDGARELAKGRLEIVNNQVDTASGTIKLKAVFENRDHALWPGLSVSTRMRIGTVANALVVPEDAVQHGPKGLFAFVVDGENRAHAAPIKVSTSGGGRAVVTSGLQPDQRVVTEGQYRVQDGTLVAERSSATRQARAEPSPRSETEAMPQPATEPPPRSPAQAAARATSAGSPTAQPSPAQPSREQAQSQAGERAR